MATGLMEAAVLETFDASFRVAAVARPAPGLGQVLVRIAASAVNPLDIKIHLGEAAHALQPLPTILGIDLAGVVDAIGPGVTGFRRGDEVYDDRRRRRPARLACRARRRGCPAAGAKAGDALNA